MPLAAEASPSFLFAARLPAIGEPLELAEDESHHLVRVCRARIGERVHVTDGEGRVALARIDALGSSARLAIESLESIARSCDGTILCGAPEGERADWLIEKLAELGVSAFVPIESRRAGWSRWDRRRDRFERLALAALRQSRRPHRMRILEPRALSLALRSGEFGGARWLADPDGSPAAGSALAPGPQVALIGPAQGFEASERDSCIASGFVPISLSEGRLRTETAALAAASWIAIGALSRAPGPVDERPGSRSTP
jgi:16S rRNA (uracil1498-N3)-methyltransferase